ncbi:MFS transporter [Streptomyces sp. WAC01280]|uniref:MFS transporter n=1 Tax=Streptomyces sp. WAC01280 TaxID=2487424 RepID=UPI00163B745B|nr:MFS transporter [Streptomyces sp. WAC01280]
MSRASVAMPRKRRGGLFWHQSFRFFWFSEASSALGASVAVITLPMVAVVNLQASPMTLGLLTGAVWLPWLLIGLPAGAWVDRMPVRPLMLVCQGVNFLLYTSIPVAHLLDVLSVYHLILVALLTGSTRVFIKIASFVFVSDLVDRDDLIEGNAKIRGTESVAEIAGPSIGGAFAQAVGAIGALFATGMSFLVSMLCLLSMGSSKSNHRAAGAMDQPGRGKLRREIGQGLKFVTRDPYIRTLTVSGAATNMALIGFQTIQMPFLMKDVGAPPAAIGLLLTSMGVGGLFGALVVRRVSDRFGSARSVILCELILAPFSLLIPLTTSGAGLVLMAVGGMAVSARITAGNIIQGSFRQAYCPPYMLGRITSAMRVLRYSFIPVGALSAGALASLFGTRAVAWGTMAFLALTSLILMAGPLRKTRDFPEVPVVVLQP